MQSNGLKTNRDAWVYNSSRTALERNVRSMIEFFNAQADAFERTHPAGSETKSRRAELASRFVDRDSTRFNWDHGDFDALARADRYALKPGSVRLASYRPFFQQHVLFDPVLNNRTYRLPTLFPLNTALNDVIVTQQTGPAPFFATATTNIPDLVVCGAGNPTYAFARWRYQDTDAAGTLFAEDTTGPITNLNPAGVDRFRQALGEDISDDDVFYYVYGVLHSPDFRSTFETNLKKEAPRVPLVNSRDDFDAFVAAGTELLELHVGYETVEPYPLVEEWADGADPDADPSVLLVGARKMAYPRVADPETGTKVPDRTRLVYNPHLTLSGIPLRVHDYVLGTRSGVDWIIDRYYVKTDKASGIVNDPNQWGLERGEPRYIVELVKRVVTVSLRTVEIVDSLPRLTF